MCAASAQDAGIFSHKENTMTKEELKRLLSESMAAKQTCEILARRNTHGLSIDDSLSLDIDYRTAIKKYSVALTAYENAIDAFVQQNTGPAPCE